MSRPRAAPPDPLAAAADRLHSASIHLLRALRRQDVAAGIGPAQLSALSVLVFAGPRTLTDLARAEQVSPPTMSRIVGALEHAGLLRRVAVPADARASRLLPTAKGRRLMQEGRRRRIGYLAARLRHLSPSEQADLEALLPLFERVARALHP
jgi:DNA-binding MarR family transcriptional regulator